MDLAPLSFVLAVSTSWAAIFLGFLPAQTLRPEAREVLKLSGAWIVVGLTAPPAIRHWYFIFAAICLGSWIKFKTERALAGKVWLNIAGGLGVSIGVIFFIQAASALCSAGLPPREYLLVLASIYLGGAVTGLAYAGWALPSPIHAPGYAWLLAVLAIAWGAVVALEWKLTASWPVHAFLATMLLTIMLSLLTFRVARGRTPERVKWHFAAAAIFSFAAQVLARELIL